MIRPKHGGQERPMNNNTPLISVIVPIYNVERYLEQCLSSLEAQTLRNIEVLCIDDGSTDSSPRIVDEFAARDERFVAVHKENGGYGKGINTGLDRARGAYVGIVESDDYVTPEMFEHLYSAAERHDFPDIAKASYWRVCHADSPQEELVPAYYYHQVAHVDVPFTLAEDAEFLFHHPSIWTAIYKRDFLTDRNIRMKEVPGAGWVDNPFLIETLAQAESIVYIDELLYCYREFETGSSSNVKDPSVIYERWLDMDDIVKRLHITAPKILEGHYDRGCAYIGMINEGFDTSEPALKENIQKMVDRIDYNAVYRSSKIQQRYKDALQQHVPFKQRMHYRLERMGLARS